MQKKILHKLHDYDYNVLLAIVFFNLMRKLKITWLKKCNTCIMFMFK